MTSKITPWIPAESSSGQVAKVMGYGTTGLFLGISAIALGRLKPPPLNGIPLRGIRATLIGIGVLAEGAALISTVVGVKRASEPSSSADPEDSPAELYNQIRADEPDLDKLTVICQKFGAEGLSRTWGDRVPEAAPHDTPLLELIYCLGDRLMDDEDTSQQVAMLELLLDSGAGVAPQSTERMSPIELAVKLLTDELQDQVVELLMNKGARFPTWCVEGHPLDESPMAALTERSQKLFHDRLAEDLQLLEAASTNDLAAARKLLEAGCHPNIRDKSGDEGRCALQIAVEEGHVEMVKLLLQYGASLENSSHASPLTLAIAPDEPDLEIVQALLDAGANVLSPSGDDGLPPVTAAFTKDRESEVAQLLVDRAWEQHLENLARYKPVERREAKDMGLSLSEEQALKKNLLEAMGADAPDLEVIRALAQQLGRALDEPIEFGRPPPLMIALADHSEEIVRILLEEGADPNLRSHEGYNAFHYLKVVPPFELVRASGDWDEDSIVQLLLEHGGRIPSTPNWKLDELQSQCSEHLYELIIGQQAVDTDFMIRGVLEGNTAVVKRYLDAGFPADLIWYHPPKLPFSALQSACEEGNVEIVRMLRAAGAPVRISNLDAAQSEAILRLLM